MDSAALAMVAVEKDLLTPNLNLITDSMVILMDLESLLIPDTPLLTLKEAHKVLVRDLLILNLTTEATMVLDMVTIPLELPMLAAPSGVSVERDPLKPNLNPITDMAMADMVMAVMDMVDTVMDTVMDMAMVTTVRT